MFGKKKQDVSNVPMAQPQQMMQQPYNQQYAQQMPIQQVVSQPVNQSAIVGIEILESGEYAYKVVTNFQLGFGACEIKQ